MRVKLDENLGQRGRDLFLAAGHDVETVVTEGLTGADDHQLIGECQSEQRCLVTLDLDFSNPFVFAPEQFTGIAVLRLPPRGTPSDLYAAVEVLIKALAGGSITGKLWIVERHRIREYQGPPDQEE
jgi:predicted nuclease of predicted toxin-antitoxin system